MTPEYSLIALNQEGEGYLVEQYGLKGIYSSAGDFILKVLYDQIKFVEDSIYLVECSDRKGLVWEGGEIITPPVYDEITWNDDRTEFVLCKEDGTFLGPDWIFRYDHLLKERRACIMQPASWFFKLTDCIFVIFSIL